MSFSDVLCAVEIGHVPVFEVFEEMKERKHHKFLARILPDLLKLCESKNENVKRLCFMISVEVMQNRNCRKNIIACGSSEKYLRHLVGALTCGTIPLVQVFLIFKMASAIPADFLHQSFACLKSIFLQNYIDQDCFVKDAKGMVLLLMASLSLKVMEKWTGEEIKKEEDYFLILKNFGASGKLLKKIEHRLSEIK